VSQTPTARRSEESALVDSQLLDQSRMQWHFADWQALASLDETQLSQHAERAQLAMLVCAARLQLGDRAAAYRAAARAREWGAGGEALLRLLVAGVHNTLARAAILLELDEDRVRSHFRRAVCGVSGDARLAYRARSAAESALLAEQLSQPAIGDQPVGPDRQTVPAMHAASSGAAQKGGFVRCLGVQDLGSAWSGNTINTAIFRHHGVLSDAGYQFTAFYVDPSTLRLARRDLTTGDIGSFDLGGEYNLLDAHNGINLGIDRAGHLHLSYDHHCDRLRYRRSLRPWRIDGWTDERPMTGVHEANVTYPAFIQRTQAGPNAPLLLLYRDGAANRGTARLKLFDEESEQWIDRPVPVLSGAGNRPWTSNAYWNHPARGNDGSLHLSYVWRTHSIGEEGRLNNINVCYAKSNDEGLSWVTSLEQPYRLPITQVNAETVFGVTPGSNLINQTGMALDSQQRPHIVFYSNDGAGVPQIQHLWFDGRQWRHHFISDRISPFNLAGRGTLRIPISRPDVVIDRADNVFVIYRSDEYGNCFVVTKLTKPSYSYETSETQVLWDAEVGYCEPVIDRQRWQLEGILTMFVQCTDQPDHDVGHEQRTVPVLLIDFELS
jgi:BNR repeat-containing family member